MHLPHRTDAGAEPGEGARSGEQQEDEEDEAEEGGRGSAMEEKPPDARHDAEEGARLSASRESSLSGYSSGGAGAAGKRGRGRPPRKRPLPSEGACSDGWTRGLIWGRGSIAGVGGSVD